MSEAADGARAGLRFVTVAFCDIGGSTELALKLQPEVWHAILEDYFANVSSALRAGGARIEKFIGDAVVGVFGGDDASEDDALDAVDAALKAVARVGAGNLAIERHGVRLSVRFGVASGRVVMANRDSSFAIGAVMNRAARLQSAASADAVAVDVRTWLLVRHHLACRPLPPVQAKGFDRPLMAWEAQRRGAPVQEGPEFINQQALFNELTMTIGSAVTGRSVIVVQGGIGSGKSRILRRLQAALQARSMPMLSVSCHRISEAQGLLPLLQLDRELTAMDGFAEDRASADSCQRPAPSAEDIQWQVRRQLARLSLTRPFVVIIDAAQWAPPALLGLLAGPWPDSGPVIFVLGCRELPDESLEDALTFTVPALSATHSYELLASLSDDDVQLHLDDPTAHLVVGRSRGNPLFLEQLAALARQGDNDLVAPSAEAALGARVGRLGASARHVLGGVGAWGGDVTPSDLEAVCALDVAEFATAIAELDRLGLLAVAAPGSQGRLSYDAAAEVAYAHMSLRDRAQIHAAIAERLRESARQEPAVIDLAARHAARASGYWHELDPDSAQDQAAALLATTCLVAAARHALARSDTRRAAELSLQARQHDYPDDALRLELAAIETYAVGASGGTIEALARIAQALDELPQQANFAATANLLVNEIALKFAEGTWDEQAVARVRMLVDEADDPGARARLRLVEGLHSARAGNYPLAETQLRSVHDAMRAGATVFGPAEVYGNLSLFLAYGDCAADEALARCKELRKEVSLTPLLQAAVDCATALLLQFSGETERAEKLLDFAEHTFTEMGHIVGRAGSLEFRSEVLDMSGSVTAAATAMRRAAAVYTSTGLHAAAARCRIRSFLLEPASPPEPSLASIGPSSSWEARLLHHQVQALQSEPRGGRTARMHLSAAVGVTAEVRGAGATFVPLLDCLRIARRLSDAVQVRSISERLKIAMAAKRMTLELPD